MGLISGQSRRGNLKPERRWRDVIPVGNIGHYDAMELSLNNGDSVTTWPDAGPNNADLDNSATNDGEPIFRSDAHRGRPGVEFSSGGVSKGADGVYDPPFWYFIVARPFNSGYMIDGYNDASNSERSLIRFEGTNFRIWSGSDWFDSYAEMNHPSILSVRWDEDDNHTVRRNGRIVGKDTEGAAGSATGYTPVTLGRHARGGQELEGIVFEAFLTTDDFTMNQATKIEKALMAKWRVPDA